MSVAQKSKNQTFTTENGTICCLTSLSKSDFHACVLLSAAAFCLFVHRFPSHGQNKPVKRPPSLQGEGGTQCLRSPAEDYPHLKTRRRPLETCKRWRRVVMETLRVLNNSGRVHWCSQTYVERRAEVRKLPQKWLWSPSAEPAEYSGWVFFMFADQKRRELKEWGSAVNREHQRAEWKRWLEVSVEQGDGDRGGLCSYSLLEEAMIGSSHQYYNNRVCEGTTGGSMSLINQFNYPVTKSQHESERWN